MKVIPSGICFPILNSLIHVPCGLKHGPGLVVMFHVIISGRCACGYDRSSERASKQP